MKPYLDLVKHVLDNGVLKKYAPNVVGGVSMLKQWSNSL